MTTTLEIVTRALRRVRVTGISETASSEDAAIALESLNGMLHRWASEGVNVFHSDLVLTDAFTFFVPPETFGAELISVLQDGGAWDAETNTPLLASTSDELGLVYKVAVTGGSSVDTYITEIENTSSSSWQIGDYLVYNGYEWLKCPSSRRFERAVIDLLALDLTQDYGKDAGAVLVKSARDGWRMIQAAYIKAPMATFDSMLMETIVTHGLGDEAISTNVENDGNVYVIED